LALPDAGKPEKEAAFQQFYIGLLERSEKMPDIRTLIEPIRHHPCPVNPS
jgi:hypothetical protein